MLHEKVFHVNKKKVDVAQKSISCRQNQDDAASKKYFGRKKVFFFPERRAIQILQLVLLIQQNKANSYKRVSF